MMNISESMSIFFQIKKQRTKAAKELAESEFWKLVAEKIIIQVFQLQYHSTFQYSKDASSL